MLNHRHQVAVEEDAAFRSGMSKTPPGAVDLVGEMRASRRKRPPTDVLSGRRWPIRSVGSVQAAFNANDVDALVGLYERRMAFRTDGLVRRFSHPE